MLILFAVYSNVRLIIRNNKINERLQTVEQELADKKIRNKKLSLLIAYYESPSYQETEARRRLALKHPDETVLQVNGVQYNKEGALEDTIYKNAEPTTASPPSNFSQWWGYFFD